MNKFAIAIAAASAVLSGGFAAYPVAHSQYSPNSYCEGRDLSKMGFEGADPCAMDPGPQYVKTTRVTAAAPYATMRMQAPLPHNNTARKCVGVCPKVVKTTTLNHGHKKVSNIKGSQKPSVLYPKPNREIKGDFEETHQP